MSIRHKLPLHEISYIVFMLANGLFSLRKRHFQCLLVDRKQKSVLEKNLPSKVMISYTIE